MKKKWKSEWGGDICFAHGKKDSRGVMILFREKCDIDIIEINNDESQGRVIYVIVKVDGTEMLLVNIYAPNEDDEAFYQKIFKMISQINIPYTVVGGDFNLVMEVDKDKYGGRASTNEKAQRCVKGYMKTMDLVDVWRVKHPMLREYTWRRRKPHVIQCRLDFFLISECILNMTKEITIDSCLLSDHSIVKLCLRYNNVTRGPGYWKLNCSMLREKEYVECIKNTVKECETSQENDKINDLLFWEILKMHIRGASIKFACNKNRASKRKILDIENKIKILEQKNKLSENEVTELEGYRAELGEIMDRKIEGEIIRSRAQIFEEGEKSSKYFLSLEKRNQGKKSISQLKDNAGNIVSDKKGIEDIIEHYYTSLYKKDDYMCPENIKEIFFANMHTCLSDDEKNTCEGYITKDELLAALKQTKNNRSPGIDGIPVDFYKVFWSDISDHMVKAMNWAIQNDELSSNHRRGIITLIPKKAKDSALIKNWRPITLLCSDYKMLSKAIANRIKIHLPKLIDSDQSGFVRNRYIGQNIDLLLQIIEYSEHNNIPGIILTADYEKAFDNLSWGFMEDTLILV